MKLVYVLTMINIITPAPLQVGGDAKLISTLAQPCLTQDLTPVTPQDGPWEPDNCNSALCIGIGIFMHRTCALTGSSCGEGKCLKLYSDSTLCCSCENVE